MGDISFADSIDRLKESFLWAAAQGGNSQDCAALLEIGADVNFRNADGDTPLLAATRRGHVETMALLLAYGADSNLVGGDSLAPIHVCARRGDSNALDVLLDANVSTNLKTREGQTALDIAKAKGHENIYSRLMRQRSTMNNRSFNTLPAVGIPPIPSREQTGNTALAALQSNANNAANPTVGSPRLNVDTPSSSSSSQRKQALDRVSDRMAKEAGSVPTQQPKSAVGGSRKDNKAVPSYSIMGQANANGNPYEDDNQQVVALKKLLDAEKVSRNVVEAKLEVFAAQNKQLIEEFTTLNKQLQRSEDSSREQEKKLLLYAGDNSALDVLGIEQLEVLEKQLKQVLTKIEQKKAVLIRNQVESQKEQRLCVVCQEKEKSVVLLPCRHMCLCATCATHDLLDQCPLCRETIVHKISVYA